MRRTILNIIRFRSIGAALTATLLAGCLSDGDHDSTMDAGHEGSGHASTPAPTAHLAGIIPEHALFVVDGANAAIVVVDPHADSVAGRIHLENAAFPHHASLGSDGMLYVSAPAMDFSNGHGSMGAAMDSCMAGVQDMMHGGSDSMRAMMGRVAMPCADSSHAMMSASGMMSTGGMMSSGGMMTGSGMMSSGGMLSGAGMMDSSMHGMGMVLALDARTGMLVRHARLTHANHNAAPGPNGTIWTSQMGARGSVLVLGSDLALVHKIEVLSTPSEVTFSADGTKALVANTGSDSVTVLDAATHRILGHIAVGDGPVAAWPGTGSRAYVDNEFGRSISVLDIAGLRVERTIDLGFAPAYVAEARDSSLWVTDAAGGKVVVFASGATSPTASITTGSAAHAIAFSMDGSKAWVTNQQAGTVSVIDVATRKLVKTIAVGGKPNGLVLKASQR